MTVAEACGVVVREWQPSTEKYLGCAVRIDDARTEEFEWGWSFSFVPVDPSECPHVYKVQRCAVDRVTGVATPVGNKGVPEAYNYLMKWRQKRAEQAAAAADAPPPEADATT